MQHHFPHPASNMSQMDQRTSERYGIALPITLEDAVGETLDISETGILFETEAEPQLGARIDMTLRYTLDGKPYHVGCEAEVVRVERVGQKVNVATKLLTPLVSAQ